MFSNFFDEKIVANIPKNRTLTLNLLKDNSTSILNSRTNIFPYIINKNANRFILLFPFFLLLFFFPSSSSIVHKVLYSILQYFHSPDTNWKQLYLCEKKEKQDKFCFSICFCWFSSLFAMHVCVWECMFAIQCNSWQHYV